MANKSDLSSKEQASKLEARQFAEEIGAIFGYTSAFKGEGIEDIFYDVGYKFLFPNYKDRNFYWKIFDKFSRI